MLDDVGAVRIIPDALQLPLRRRLLAGLGALPILLRGLDGVDLESLRLSLHFRGGGLSPLDGALCSSPNVSLAAEKDGVVWKWSDLPVKKRYTICSSWTITLLQCPPSRAADLSAPTMPLPKFVFPRPRATSLHGHHSPSTELDLLLFPLGVRQDDPPPPRPLLRPPRGDGEGAAPGVVEEDDGDEAGEAAATPTDGGGESGSVQGIFNSDSVVSDVLTTEPDEFLSPQKEAKVGSFLLLRNSVSVVSPAM